MNYPMRRTDFRMFRHTDNEIDFLLKNFDRRVIDVTDGAFHITVISGDEKRVLMRRQLTIVDAKLGWVRLFATGDEVATFPVETLLYAVVWRRSDGVEVPCYTDRDRKITGYIEIQSGPLPYPREPYVLSVEDFTPSERFLMSTHLPGPVRVGNIMGAMSAVFRCSDFRGNVIIEASMHEQPSSIHTDWFEVHREEYDRVHGFTGKTHVGFEGNFQWVRFLVEYPQMNPLSPHGMEFWESLYGRVSVIEFRN